MIRIDKMTAGRFGNRVLHYNNLMQLATTLNTDASCVFWEGDKCFSNLVRHTDWENPVDKVLDWKTILDSDELDDSGLLGPYCLHNVFWKLTKTDPRQFIKVNEKYKRNL